MIRVAYNLMSFSKNVCLFICLEWNLLDDLSTIVINSQYDSQLITGLIKSNKISKVQGQCLERPSPTCTKVLFTKKHFCVKIAQSQSNDWKRIDCRLKKPKSFFNTRKLWPKVSKMRHFSADHRKQISARVLLISEQKKDDNLNLVRGSFFLIF